MEKCIYCLRDNVEFTREHVIPESLGKFKTDNMVLHDKVCKECNKYFGDKLELNLCRYSYLSLLKTGMLSPLNTMALKHTQKHVVTSETLHITLPMDNYLDGAHLIVRTNDLKIDLQPQNIYYRISIFLINFLKMF